MLRVAATLLLVELSSASGAATFSEGKSAYDRNNVPAAERIYVEVIRSSNSSTDDRAASHRELARIAWLIDGNAPRALDHLDAARRAQGKPCDTAEMTARVYRENGMYAEAEAAGDALIRICDDPRQSDAIRLHLIGARLNHWVKAPERRQQLLAIASAEAAKFSEGAGIEAARLRLQIAVLSGDAPGALLAWKDFFWLEDQDAPQALLQGSVADIFSQGLSAGATVDQRVELADFLMRAGFSTVARRFVEARVPAEAGHPGLRKLQAYWSARDEFEAELLLANRQMARGGKTPAVLKAAAERIDRADAIWRKTLFAGLPVAGKGDDSLLKQHYGLFGTGRGETSGYPSVHRGHVIEDRQLTVSQYGKTAQVQYLVVDNMIANGFESWLWDGGPMVGGWQSGAIIVSVRPGYVNSPLNAFELTRDSVRRRELIARQAVRAREDQAKLKTLSVATLNGLNDRLQLQTIDRIAATARAQTRDRTSFRKAFLAEYGRATFEQSIEVHEGRHAINEIRGVHAVAEQAVTEYEAKLSELALATYPRLALRNMNSNVEGDGPHDRAVAKLFEQFRRWMEAHPGEIMGFDPAAPALAQLDKLTDDQIREIARGLDPLANGWPSPKTLAELP